MSTEIKEKLEDEKLDLEDKLDDLKDDLEDKLKKVDPQKVKKYGPILLGVLVVLALVVQTVRIGSINADRAEMKDQIDRMNEVIDDLTEKNNDQDKFIKDNIPVITSETLQEKLIPAYDLVTEQYNYRNADKLEQDQSWLFGWKRPFSSKSVLVTYDGVIKAGVDLSQVVPVVDEGAHTVTVTLPASRITDNNIPQETITVVEVKNGLFNPVTIDDYNTFISEQKIVMEKKAIDQGLLKEADQNAREIVTSLLTAVPGVSTTPQEGYYTLVVK